MITELKERIATINSGIVPEGYKKTKVGIVPVEWEIKVLGKISRFLDNSRKPVKENERHSGIYPYYGASGIIDYVDDFLFDGEFILLGEDGANIIMRSLPLAFKATGKIWVNNHAHVILPNANCNIDYLVNALESLNYEKYNSGTAQPKLNREVCENILLPFPPLPEQQKIAEILSTQDNLIALQEKKIDQLKKLKKAYLQKMFPKKGSQYPELRFQGFTDAWEQRKVGDTYNVTRGYVLAAPKTSPIKTDEKPFPVYSSQTKDNGLMGYYNEYLYENAITWTTDGANAGTVNFRAGKFYCTNVCGVLLSDAGYSNKAAAEALNMVAWKWVSHVGNPKLMNNVMAEIEISLPPTVQEQEKISEFLTSLDNLITLHQRKLDQEKQKKKALMQLLLTGKARIK